MLTEREKAILYLLLSTEKDEVLADRLAKELKLTKQEWEDLERDLSEFLEVLLNNQKKKREGKKH